MEVSNIKISNIDISELSVNDLVSVSGRFLTVIENGNAIGGYLKQDTKYCKVIGIDTETGIYINESCETPFFNGIELTDDILKQFGFSNYPEEFKQVWSLNGEIFSIYKIGDKYKFIATNDIHIIRYVHELQHWLRMCGHKTLANNIKLNYNETK